MIDCSTISLLIDNGADVNAQESNGNTALHNAIKSYKTDRSKLLIKSGAKIHIVNDDGESPFDYAKKYDHKILKLLTEN